MIQFHTAAIISSIGFMLQQLTTFDSSANDRDVIGYGGDPASNYYLSFDLIYKTAIYICGKPSRASWGHHRPFCSVSQKENNS